MLAWLFTGSSTIKRRKADKSSTKNNIKLPGWYKSIYGKGSKKFSD